MSLRSVRGSLLTEVVIALALLIPVVVLVAGMFPYSFSVDRSAWTRRAAQNLARLQLEAMRAKSFDSVASLVGSQRVDNVEFLYQVEVSDIGSPPVREKRVICRVNWAVKNGQKSLNQETRLSRYFEPDQ